MVVKKEAMSTNHLPLDIQLIILLQLPVKSLLRFKLVCKSWNAIISEHDFAKNHLMQSKKYSRNQNSFLWRPRKYPDEDYRLINFENNKFQAEAISRHPYPGRLLCSADDGLLLLDTPISTHYKLWNPSSKQNTLIRCPYGFISDEARFGFCRGPTLDDYKIVVIHKDYYAVFSCKKNLWTKKKKFPYNSSRFILDPRVVFFDGFSFWVMLGIIIDTIEILYFDPRDEIFKKLHHPRNLDPEDNSFRLTILNGCLCLYNNTSFGTHRQLQIWILRDRVDVDSTSWTQLMIIDKGCLHRIEQRNTYITPIFLTEKKELVMRVNCYERIMFGIYNSMGKKYENIDVPASMVVHSFSEIVPYTDSLFFPIQ